jgi:hypothetical protein
MRSVVHLLHAAGHDRRDVALDDFSDGQIRWVIEAGLGPVLFRHVAESPRARSAPSWPTIQGADLTARLMTAELQDAMDAILGACDGRTRPPTLLKGISAADELYPEPHLRSMRDIDFLVATDDLAPTESALRALGYRQESRLSHEFYATHHHTMPFRHPQTGVWVEVHRGLCPTWSPVAADAAFGAAQMAAEQRRSEFRGRPVQRLSAELQIVYLAAHWAHDFRLAGGLVAMLDTIHLLNNSRAIRWERVLSLLDGAVAANAVYLLLSYLDRHRLVELPPGVGGELAGRQRAFGRGSLRALHAMIDRYVTNGRPLGLLMSERSFPIVWHSLLRPEPGLRKLARIGWWLLPSRSWLTRAAPGPALPSSAPETS